MQLYGGEFNEQRTAHDGALYALPAALSGQRNVSKKIIERPKRLPTPFLGICGVYDTKALMGRRSF